MARPTKYTAEKAALILSRLRAGNTRKASAQSSGIAFTTFLRWIAGNDSFATDVEQAEADAECYMVATIAKAAKEGDWRASESWLKRRRRDEWGDSLNLTNKSDDDLLNEAAEIVAKAKLDGAGAGGAGGGGAAGSEPDAAGSE